MHAPRASLAFFAALALTLGSAREAPAQDRPAAPPLEIVSWLAETAKASGDQLDSDFENLKLEVAVADTPLDWELARCALALLPIYLMEESTPSGHREFVLVRAVGWDGESPSHQAPAPREGVTAAILWLRHESGAQILEVLDSRFHGTLAKHARLETTSGRQILVVVDEPSTVACCARVAHVLDDAGARQVVRRLPVHAISATDAAELLTRILPPVDGSPRFLADETSDSVFMATTGEDAAAVDSILADVDRKDWTLRKAGLRIRARLGERGVTVLGLGFTGVVVVWLALFLMRARKRTAR